MDINLPTVFESVNKRLTNLNIGTSFLPSIYLKFCSPMIVSKKKLLFVNYKLSIETILLTFSIKNSLRKFHWLKASWNYPKIQELDSSGNAVWWSDDKSIVRHKRECTRFGYSVRKVNIIGELFINCLLYNMNMILKL